MAVMTAIGLSGAVSARNFLFIGDSVTDGGWGRSGGSALPSNRRNLTDLNHIYGHGYMMMCAARFQSELPYAGLRFMNRGISGNTLADLEKRWDEDVLALEPDIVSVLIGTNDAGEFSDRADGEGSGSVDYEEWEGRYSDLLTRLERRNPDVRIVLGTPFAGIQVSPLRRELTDSLAARVRNIAIKHRALCVDYDSLFRRLESMRPDDGYWIWDGVHPTAAGHERMARLMCGRVKEAGWLASGADNRVTAPVSRERLDYSPSGPYEATWESLEQNYRTPEWFKNAKFGIFIHWGPYVVAASGSEWYPRHMYNAMSAEHRQRWGRQQEFGYKDFIPMFRAEKFDAKEWAALFRESGAGYVIPTAEHHDGFAMYDSELTEWNAARMGPCRDIIGELAQAVRAEGMKFGVSNHRVENWDFMYPSLPADSTDLFLPEYAGLYGPPQPPVAESGMGPSRSEEGRHPQSDAFMDEWQLRVMEIIDRYRPDLLYFDNGINYRSMDPWKLAVARYYYNSAVGWGTDVSIQSKSRAYLAGSILDFERESRAPRRPYGRYWQVDDPIGHKFGYVEGLRLQDAGDIIRNLVDNVACGGNLCLNISPRADGTIPDDQKERLQAIGAWLRKYGDGIYGTTPFEVHGERTGAEEHHSGQEIRFTSKSDGSLYAFVLRPTGEPFVIRSLAGRKIRNIIHLADGVRMKFSMEPDGVRIDRYNGAGEPAVGFRIELQ